MTSAIADNNTNNAQIGLKPFFKSKVEALEIAVRDGTQNLRRLEAQRNELNSRGKKTLSLSLSLSLLKRIQSQVLFFTLSSSPPPILPRFDLLFLSLSLSLSFCAFENQKKCVFERRLLRRLMIDDQPPSDVEDSHRAASLSFSLS